MNAAFPVGLARYSYQTSALDAIAGDAILVSAIIQLFRRSRFAFAVARLCHGASACLFSRPRIIAKVESCIAAAFSVAIRRYSAREHVP
jgi:hypothetical protein